MVSHWSLSDSKSPQVSRSLLSILADLYNRRYLHVLRFQTLPALVTKPRRIFPSAPITIGINVLFHSFFGFLVRSKFSLSGPLGRRSPQNNRFFLLTITREWSSGRDKVICLHVKFSQNLMHLFFQDRFGVVHLLFIQRVKFQFLAQFPVNHLPHTVL